ncbi:MAG: fimbrillin family protein [Muribaculaceae bacterium]|nr:fimbrillin family protein [Muribaculaceae bacterium]
MRTTVKTTYIALIGALTLSACSQEETRVIMPDGSDRKIVFHTSLPGVETKATEIATDLTYLHLTAFNVSDDSYIENGKIKEYVDDIRIDKDAGSSRCASDLCIWPEQGHEDDVLHFFAYYPDLALGATTLNETSADGSDKTLGYTVKDFRIADNIADHVDFVTAYASGSMTDNYFSGVSLRFDHQLSRIQVYAKGQHKSCDIEIAGVRIGGVTMQQDFEFPTAPDAEGAWKETENTEKGTVEYIFRPGDAIVKVGADAQSIIGSKIDADNDNCAIVLPTTDATGWDIKQDIHNVNAGMYISVLLRVLDKTPGGNLKQQYPYFDKSQGLNAMDIPRECIVVDNDGIVTRSLGTLYKDDAGKYYTDANKTAEYKYTLAAGEEIREFGWAALPVTGDWKPGYIYSYTLDYTGGVGVHDPKCPDPRDESNSSFAGPLAGDAIISDVIGVSVSVNGWQGKDNNTHTVVIPGS